MKGIGIIKTASFIPPIVQTNEEVCENIVGLTTQWIEEKIGLKRRFHVSKFDTASTMVHNVACKLVLNDPPIGLVVVTSSTQDYMFPALSARIHKDISLPKDCQVLDINTNCTGLITGTTIAVERMKANPRIKFALVIGVEVLSKFTDKTDKFTAPFFSDGASGVLLGRVPEGYGHLESFFCTDSSAYEDVRLKRGGFIEHNGKETWTQAVTNVPYVMKGVCNRAGMTIKDVDFFIFHQSNKVLCDYILAKHNIPPEKTYTNVQEIGNTGAASIGIALDEAIRHKLIKKGNILMLAGVGAGFNFGANLWKVR